MDAMRIVQTLYLLCIVQHRGEATWYEPSFISDWYAAIGNTSAVLIIPHNLGEYPVKADVQVKINDTGKDYIFGGLGSSQRDDDYNDPMSGVVYIYNNRNVKLTFPFCSNCNQPLLLKGLAYTGAGVLYHGPTQLLGPYMTGFVRIRLWLAIDMPPTVINQSIYMSNTDNYKEINHNLGYYPHMVSIRTNLCNRGYMSDGIGAVFMSATHGPYNSIGGVLFGYDDTKIRLWVPSPFNSTTLYSGGVFHAEDGYSLSGCTGGVVSVLAWSFDCSQEIYRRQFIVGNGISHDSRVTFPCEYSLNNFFVSLQVKIADGDGLNEGMVFNGVGTTQANGRFSYGGVVYAYNELETLFWRPNNKPIIVIQDRWGSGISSQSSMSADLIVKVFHLRKSECPFPDTIANATFSVTGVKYADIVTYECDSGYRPDSGDLVRTCLRNRHWSGFPLTCTLITCHIPDSIIHGWYVPVLTLYLPATTITYGCKGDYLLIGGLNRTCDSLGNWVGTVPSCLVYGCPIPEPVDNGSNSTSTAVMSTFLYQPGTSVTYACDSGYSLAIGNSMRKCHADGRWGGISPACTAITCPTPDQVGNGSYTPILAVYNPGAVISYQCDSGYCISGGSVSRTCNSVGSWDGIPPACATSGCSPATTKVLSDKEMEDIITTIHVNKKSTSSYKRSLNSAPDERYSSMVLGYGGVAFLISVLCCVLLPDISRILKHFVNRNRTHEE